jgi:predicted NBD/HSP70 family sugar kinase
VNDDVDGLALAPRRRRHHHQGGALGAAWRRPVRIANGVASGGVDEHRLGAGAGPEDLVFVPIGTGIAASIVPADVTASALGDRGGLIGAALLAHDGWAPES